MLRVLTILPLLLVPAAAGAQEINELKGTISGFECDENCYLFVDFGAAGWLSALCEDSTICDPWKTARAMPAEFLGAEVTVALGVGDHLRQNIPVPYIAFRNVTLQE